LPVIVGANIDGTEKNKLLVIGKNQKSKSNEEYSQEITASNIREQQKSLDDQWCFHLKSAQEELQLKAIVYMNWSRLHENRWNLAIYFIIQYHKTRIFCFGYLSRVKDPTENNLWKTENFQKHSQCFKNQKNQKKKLPSIPVSWESVEKCTI
jgi:hypothetical protein